LTSARPVPIENDRFSAVSAPDYPPGKNRLRNSRLGVFVRIRRAPSVIHPGG
jgi:hypothetical protein